MSKLYNKYLKLKKKDDSKYYLFKVGAFYIFIEKDAENISDLTGLKLTKLNDSVYKCGFPISSKEKYSSIINQLGIKYEIIEDFYGSKIIFDMIKKINIEDISVDEAYSLIKKLHESLNE